MAVCGELEAVSLLCYSIRGTFSRLSSSSAGDAFPKNVVLMVTVGYGVLIASVLGY